MTIIRKKMTRRLSLVTKLVVFIIVFVLAMTITFSDVYGATF